MVALALDANAQCSRAYSTLAIHHMYTHPREAIHAKHTFSFSLLSAWAHCAAAANDFARALCCRSSSARARSLAASARLAGAPVACADADVSACHAAFAASSLGTCAGRPE